MNDIAYFFTFSYADGRDPERYTARLRQAIETWQREGESNYKKLSYRRGPGFIQVSDKRSFVKPGVYTFDGVAGQAYLACERGASPSRVWERLSPAFRTAVDEHDVQRFLDQMVERRLVFEEDGRYLSLAVPEREEHDAGELDVADTDAWQESLPTTVLPVREGAVLNGR